jgi:hypothetical protein
VCVCVSDCESDVRQCCEKETGSTSELHALGRECRRRHVEECRAALGCHCLGKQCLARPRWPRHEHTLPRTTDACEVVGDKKREYLHRVCWFVEDCSAHDITNK